MKSKKSVILLILPIILLLLLILLVYTYFKTNNTKVIQILATSDVHGRFDTYNYVNDCPDTQGSLTQVSKQVQTLRNNNPNTLLVDAGDMAQDNMSSIFLDDDIHPTMLAMNEMQYDTYTLGNHEFNYGKEGVEKLIKQPNADVLCGNVYREDGSRLGKSYVIKEIDGIKIAIIGMTNPNIAVWDKDKLQGYNVTSPIDEAKNSIDEIKQSGGADLYIGVMHLGTHQEFREDDSAAALAQACPEFSAIVCGHAHETISDLYVNNAILVEPGKCAQNLSKIDITVKKDIHGEYKIIDKSSENINMDNQPIDEDLNQKLKPYHDKALEECNKIIGTLYGGDLVPEPEIKGICPALVQDTPLIDLILSAQYNCAKKYIPNGSRIVSSANVFDTSANIKEGPIKDRDTAKIYKYDSRLIILKINGKQLRDYMEWSAAFYNKYNDGDLTISFNNRPITQYDMFAGVTYEINISNDEGSRIENLKYIDGTDVSDDDIIYLDVNDYRYYSTLKDGLFKDQNIELVHATYYDEISMFKDIIKDYIINTKNREITNNCDNNWKITGYKFNKDYIDILSKLVDEGTIAIDKSSDGKYENCKSITVNDISPYL